MRFTSTSPRSLPRDGFVSKLNPRHGEARFLQIVATAAAAEVPVKPTKRLTRVPFKVSRLMEFCTRRELINQTGHDTLEWPLVVLKELADNALDDAEEAEIAPVISDRREGRIDHRQGQRLRHSSGHDQGHSRLRQFGCHPAKPTSRRRAARRATRSRPCCRWPMSSTRTWRGRLRRDRHRSARHRASHRLLS